MSDLKEMLADQAGRMLADLCTPESVNAAGQGGFSPALWDAIESSGLHQACLGEAAGGAGLGLNEVLPMVRRFANFGAPVPIADALLASVLIERAGLAQPPGLIALAAAPVTLDSTASGRARVPYGRHAAGVVLWQPQDDGLRIAVLDAATAGLVRGENLAGEASDLLELGAAPLLASGRAAMSAEDLLAWGALLRAAQLVGVMEKALALAVEHASARVQFGRPLSAFQAVQHSLVIAFGECAAATAAMEAAAALSSERPHALAVPAAKIRAGKAATVAARTAHQTLGAMGYTHEHPLHQYTRRIWSWRDDFGTEAEWARKLGAQARLHAQAGNPDGLWNWITLGGAA